MQYSLRGKYQPKTQRTIRLLKQNKTEDVKWELDSVQEIDQKLSQFCQKSKDELFPEESDQKSIIKEKKGSKKDQNLVNHYGHLVIKTAFHGLILNENIHHNQEEYKQISNNMLKAFDINPMTLIQMKKEERIVYLRKQMNDTIDTLLKNWGERILQKEKKLKDQDKQDQIEKYQEKKQKQHLKWLQIRSQHDALKSQLKSYILFYLNKYENQLKVNEDFSIRNKQFILKSVPFVSTRDVFENMEQQGYGNFSHFLKNLSQDRIRRIKSKNSKEKEIQEISNENKSQLKWVPLEWNSELERDFLTHRNHSKNLFSSEVKSSNFNLSSFQPYQQILIKESRKSGKREELMLRYADGEELNEVELEFLANTSELLNGCVDRKFVQSSINHIENEQLQNMELKIAEDIILQQDILKRIVHQGRLNFLKRKIEKEKLYVKKAQQLQQEQIEKDQIRVLNFRYIKVLKKLIDRMEKEQKFENNVPKDVPGANILNKFMQNKLSAKKLIEQFRQLIMQEEIRQTQNELKLSNADQKQIKKSQSLYDRIKELEKNSKHNVQIQSVEKLRLPIRCYGETQLDKFKLKRHNYHPPSKLFIQKKKEYSSDESGPEEEVGNILEKQKQVSRKQDELNFFNISSKTSNSLRNPNQFSKFYSGGPTQRSQRDSFFELKPNQKELKSIITIQRWIRRFLLANLIKQQILNKKNDIYYFYHKNLENVWNTFQVEKESAKTNNQVQTQLHDIVDKAYNQMHLINKKQYSKHNKLTSDQYIMPKSIDTIDQIKNKILGPSYSHKRNFTQSSMINSSISTVGTDNFAIFHTKIKIRKLLIAGQKNQPLIATSCGFNFTIKEINTQDTIGNTALHYATLNNNKEFAKWLIQRQADPNIQNFEGNTPTHFVFQNSSIEIFVLILEAKPDLNIANKKGETPLAFANEKFLTILDLKKGNSHLFQKPLISSFDRDRIFSENPLQDNNKLLNREQINDFGQFNDEMIIFEGKNAIQIT